MHFSPPADTLVTYPALVVSGLLVKLGALLPLGMTFLSRRTQVAMSTFIWRARRKALPKRTHCQMWKGNSSASAQLSNDVTLLHVTFSCEFFFLNFLLLLTWTFCSDKKNKIPRVGLKEVYLTLSLECASRKLNRWYYFNSCGFINKTSHAAGLKRVK